MPRCAGVVVHWVVVAAGLSAGCSGHSDSSTTTRTRPPTDEPPVTYCFAAETRIATDRGEIAIQDLQVGENVLSVDHGTGRIALGQVTAIVRHEDSVFGELPLPNGRVLRVTPDHPVFVEREYTPVETLRPGQELCMLDSEGSAALEKAVSGFSFEADFQGATFDLTVEPYANFFAEGLLVHNKGPCEPLCPCTGGCPWEECVCYDTQTPPVPLCGQE